MAKRQTTVRIDEDLDRPLEEFMKNSKINLTVLFNDYLRNLLGVGGTTNLFKRVENLEQKVVDIEARLDVD